MAEIGNGDRASIGERQWRMTFQGRLAARRVDTLRWAAELRDPTSVELCRTA